MASLPALPSPLPSWSRAQEILLYGASGGRVVETEIHMSSCHEAQYTGQGHAWRIVCATGGGLLRQCLACKEIEWSDGRESFDALRAEMEVFVSRKIEP